MEKERGYNIEDSVEASGTGTRGETPEKEKKDDSPAGEQKETPELDLSTEERLRGLLDNAVLEARTEAFRNYIISNPESLKKDKAEIEEMSDFQIRHIMEKNPELLHEAVGQDLRCAEVIRLATAIEKEREKLSRDSKLMFLKFAKAVVTVMRIGPERIEKLEEEAKTDLLTALLNRRGFQEQLEIEKERFERHGRPFMVVYLDMDDLKKINDEEGHHKGDEALVSLADTIKKNCRAVDHAARIGGDEFAILFTETDNEEIFSRLRSEASNISVGYCRYDENISSIEEAIRIAETAMRKNKKERKMGRER